ncbi:MAG: TraR/DksA C4-type zinc finger protein [bacterium]|nr:TraR/DksA C4-type zinc finger protein [bacterium]
MDKNTQAKIREGLLKKKESLQTMLSSFATKDPNLKGDWDSKYPRVPEGGLEEAAGEVEEYSTSLPIEHNLETQLQDVDNALGKIEQGNYGACESCGMQIEEERLIVSPGARFCVMCSGKQG